MTKETFMEGTVSSYKKMWEVQQLIAQWKDDPSWDIETTEGFETWKSYLHAIRLQYEQQQHVAANTIDVAISVHRDNERGIIYMATWSDGDRYNDHAVGTDHAQLLRDVDRLLGVLGKYPRYNEDATTYACDALLRDLDTIFDSIKEQALDAYPPRDEAARQRLSHILTQVGKVNTQLLSDQFA